MIPTNDLEEQQDKLENTLKKAWKLFDDTQQYLQGDFYDNPVPDFSRRSEQLVRDEQTTMAERLEHYSLSQLTSLINSCSACPLNATRTHSVPGEGVANAKVMVVGEGPGADEDRLGRPFVGRAGRYLDNWLAAISLDRKQNVYITNIVKCRPPNNRDPRPEEAQECLPYLKRQIALIKPASILCVGRIAIHFLLGREEGVGKLRGTFYRFEGIPVLVTYHPAAVLRNPNLRAPVWEDLKRLASYLAIPIPPTRT